MGSAVYPADFLLLASMNPCNCGYYPDMQKCRCTPGSIRRYLSLVFFTYTPIQTVFPPRFVYKFYGFSPGNSTRISFFRIKPTRFFVFHLYIHPDLHIFFTFSLINPTRLQSFSLLWELQNYTSNQIRVFFSGYIQPDLKSERKTARFFRIHPTRFKKYLKSDNVFHHKSDQMGTESHK